MHRHLAYLWDAIFSHKVCQFRYPRLKLYNVGFLYFIFTINEIHNLKKNIVPDHLHSFYLLLQKFSTISNGDMFLQYQSIHVTSLHQQNRFKTIPHFNFYSIPYLSSSFDSVSQLNKTALCQIKAEV